MTLMRHSLIGSDDGIQQKPISEVSLYLVPIHIIELSNWTLDFDAYLVTRFQMYNQYFNQCRALHLITYLLPTNILNEIP